jgi:hypothetical protein
VFRNASKIAAKTNPLAGTWFVSFQFEFEDVGQRFDVYEKPWGFIIVTADGRNGESSRHGRGEKESREETLHRARQKTMV